MTKRDFDLIARVLRIVRNGCVQTHSFELLDAVAVTFADELARVNPRFDRARFLQACGVAS